MCADDTLHSPSMFWLKLLTSAGKHSQSENVATEALRIEVMGITLPKRTLEHSCPHHPAKGSSWGPSDQQIPGCVGWVGVVGRKSPP